MKVVSFNIRTLWDRDGINSFIHRIGLIYDKINSEKPDLVAFQEVTEKHIDVLRKLFPEYEFYGSGRLEGSRGEGLYTAVLKECIEVLSHKIFWLSDTPEVPASRFKSQSIYPRICIKLRLREKRSGGLLNVYNVHLDYIGMSTHTDPPGPDEVPEDFDYENITNPRKLGIECVLSEMRAAGEDGETVLLGDFNATAEDECLAVCKEAGLIDVSSNLPISFHAFGKFEKAIKIDYIFVSEKLASLAKPAEIWDDEKHGIYLSDHYPIVTEFSI
jgi:endonuclease/exonuclease/phosphatase family metal-dependent hydrolase